jgi:hypothetical protein
MFDATLPLDALSSAVPPDVRRGFASPSRLDRLRAVPLVRAGPKPEAVPGAQPKLCFLTTARRSLASHPAAQPYKHGKVFSDSKHGKGKVFSDSR